MSFASKVGSLLRQTIYGRLGINETRSVPSIYHSLRYMSSSRIFIGARIIHDRETGRSRGFGFVSFTSNEEDVVAITCIDGKDLHGRHAHVNYATERTGGFRSGGGSYGGGGYSQNHGYRSGGGYSQNDGYGTGGGYSQNYGNASGGSYSQSSGLGYDGTSEGTSTGGTKDDFGYDDNVGNVGKGY